MSGKREYGDYQTPIDFAEKVCRYLKDYRHIHPSAVIEPTCGVGNFLKSSLLLEADEYYGIEINPEYCKECRSFISNSNVNVINADFFTFSSKSLIKNKRQVLVLGNPPWATNSMLSSIGSSNIPPKTNFKQIKGLNAITGEGNFDICEYIILRLISEYKNTNTIISMLCKTSVARNVFKELKRNRISFASCDILQFDALKVFGINTSACILLIQLSAELLSSNGCNVYDFEHFDTVKSRFGYLNDQLYSNLDTDKESFDGRCCFEWRQGIKHDCSKIMELTVQNGKLQNGNNEEVQIEDDLVFPLVKSSMFKVPVIHKFSKYVIVTQKKVREDTKYLEQKMPRTWEYLNRNLELFKARKSSIYRGAPPFSVFGVGGYSYSKYKVGVSGFYKQPLFSVLYSDDEKPVMTDDTSYFIGFDNYDMAYVSMLILNSKKVQDFLTNISFLDAKRPYTKKVLERIDFSKIVDSLSFEELIETEQGLDLPYHVTLSMYDDFKSSLEIGQMKFA